MLKKLIALAIAAAFAGTALAATPPTAHQVSTAHHAKTAKHHHQHHAQHHHSQHMASAR
jgi:hypothetical protein